MRKRLRWDKREVGYTALVCFLTLAFVWATWTLLPVGA